MAYKRQKLTKREFLHQQYRLRRTEPQAEATWRMIRAVGGWPRRDGPKNPVTRDQFIHKQRHKGRSYRQGAGTWKMMKGAKHWLSQYKLNPDERRQMYPKGYRFMVVQEPWTVPPLYTKTRRQANEVVDDWGGGSYILPFRLHDGSAVFTLPAGAGVKGWDIHDDVVAILRWRNNRLQDFLWGELRSDEGIEGRITWGPRSRWPSHVEGRWHWAASDVQDALARLDDSYYRLS